MKKELLSEINRTREIMGLSILIEQEEKATEQKATEQDANKAQKKIQKIIDEIVDVFKKIDPKEREEFKKVIIGDISGSDFEGTEKMTKEEKEAIVNKLTEEFNKIEKQPISESLLLGEQYINWRRWRDRKFRQMVSLLTLNLIRVRGWTNTKYLFGRRGIDIRIRGARKGSAGKLSSLGDITVETPENEWEDLMESRAARKFKKKIVKGKDLWDSSWNATVTSEEGEETYPYRAVMVKAIETYDGFKKWGKRKVRITVSDKPKETKIPIEEEKKYEAREFQFPKAGQPSADFFEDNEFIPTQAFKDNLQLEIIGPLQEVAKELDPPPGKPAYWLRTLGISTSCSARNNGTSSDGVKRTWVQLAEARAQAGLEYIKEELAKLNPPMLIGSNGGDQETEVVINAKGTNVGKTAKDDRDLTGTSGPVWGEDGESTNVADYDKHKYFNVAFDILLNDTEEVDPTEDIKWETVYTDKLAINYNIPARSERWKNLNIPFRLPKLRLGLPVFGWLAGLFKRKPRWDDCPNF